ncbi:hypothetical protein P7F88_07100 [Vibrio hannami]|uniref:zinc ribbon-containing protein n=1 Tax=Vibrio hannami TaxID=2717094 RepID=UPI00241054BB|nr:hypothetical protein [Vibrio hannami]MDG3085874.1 hypothetical protein [Vibrio hannami]
MDDKNAENGTRISGEMPGIGVYICTQCHFAIVVVRDNFILPSCPCCENNSFIESEEDAEFDD